jgi:GT2 family glycosyltransferase
MIMRPEVSVVIPTHNRAERLRRTLASLETQHAAAGSFEVIVALDDCTDDTPRVIAAFEHRLPLRCCINTGRRGAAAARNAGAAIAHGRILLFLDDDMEALPSLVEAHLTAHRVRVDQVVLGYFPMQPPAPDDDWFTKASRLWWAEGFAARAQPQHRFTFLDLCTGNVSLPSRLFFELGGFDEQIDGAAAGEDYEFGYRLIQRAVPFVYAPDAASVHHTHTPFAVRLRRARQEGVGQALVVRRHPELFAALPIARLSGAADRTPLRQLWGPLWRHPWLSAAPVAVLRALVSLLARWQMTSLVLRTYPFLYGHAYLSGVREVMSLREWEQLVQEAPLEPPQMTEVDVMLPADLSRLDALMDSQRVDAVRVWWRGAAVGRIAPVAGALPLTGAQLHRLLQERFGAVMLAALLEQQASVAAPRDMATSGDRW